MIENLLVCDRSAAIFLAVQLGKGAEYWTERMEKDTRRRWYNQEFTRKFFWKPGGGNNYYMLRHLVDYVEAAQNGFSGVSYESETPVTRNVPDFLRVYIGVNHSDNGQLSVLSSFFGGYRKISPECARQYSKDLSAAVRLCSQYEFDFPNWDVVTKREIVSRSNLMKLIANKRLAIQSSGSCHG